MPKRKPPATAAGLGEYFSLIPMFTSPQADNNKVIIVKITACTSRGFLTARGDAGRFAQLPLQGQYNKNVLQMEKLSHREVKLPARDHTVTKCWSWDLPLLKWKKKKLLKSSLHMEAQERKRTSMCIDCALL